MEKVGLPKGLIRYESEENIENKKPFEFNLRMKGYTVVLSILIAVLITMLFMRNDVEATILRLPGELYKTKENNIISNVYTYKLINKTSQKIEDIHFELISHEGTIKLIGAEDFDIEKQEFYGGSLFIEIARKELSDSKENLKIGVFSDGKLIETTTTNFMGPRSFR